MFGAGPKDTLCEERILFLSKMNEKLHSDSRDLSFLTFLLADLSAIAFLANTPKSMN